MPRYTEYVFFFIRESQIPRKLIDKITKCSNTTLIRDPL